MDRGAAHRGTGSLRRGRSRRRRSSRGRERDAGRRRRQRLVHVGGGRLHGPRGRGGRYRHDGYRYGCRPGLGADDAVAERPVSVEEVRRVRDGSRFSPRRSPRRPTREARDAPRQGHQAARVHPGRDRVARVPRAERGIALAAVLVGAVLVQVAGSRRRHRRGDRELHGDERGSPMEGPRRRRRAEARDEHADVRRRGGGPDGRVRGRGRLGAVELFGAPGSSRRGRRRRRRG